LFGEDDYAKDLRQQAKALDVADRVHFLAFRPDVPSLMRLSDVVVHTSVAPEPFGRVIVEGMLALKPVVAARAGGAGEIVDDGVSGVLVAPGDANALAAALAGLLANPAKAQALAETGYRMALERFSLRSMLENVEQQIQHVLAQ
jgi:glycosyltransferase involved in cell wall biosynthesis